MENDKSKYKFFQNRIWHFLRVSRIWFSIGCKCFPIGSSQIESPEVQGLYNAIHFVRRMSGINTTIRSLNNSLPFLSEQIIFMWYHIQDNILDWRILNWLLRKKSTIMVVVRGVNVSRWHKCHGLSFEE